MVRSAEVWSTAGLRCWSTAGSGVGLPLAQVLVHRRLEVLVYRWLRCWLARSVETRTALELLATGSDSTQLLARNFPNHAHNFAG